MVMIMVIQGQGSRPGPTTRLGSGLGGLGQRFLLRPGLDTLDWIIMIMSYKI